MGGNGSFLSGITNFENGRMYKTVSSIGDNIKVLETKNPKAGVKLPEESHTPNRTYATFYRNGKEISFNLGSITTIIVGVLAAIALSYSQPELFSNWYVAAITAYTAPQITDGIITAGTRYIAGNDEHAFDDMIGDEGV